MEIPLNSLITQIKREQDVYIVSGIAYGDGEIIEAIELSLDKGATWIKVELENEPNSENVLDITLYGWTRWEYPIPVSKLYNQKDKKTEIWCRAISNKGKQKTELGSISKEKNDGYLYNGWHQAKIVK